MRSLAPHTPYDGVMCAAVQRSILMFVFGFLVACGSCGHRQSTPTARAVAAAAPAAVTPLSVIVRPDARKYDAYGPWQWCPFTGVNRDNIYSATAPTTGPVDDSVLFPADDAQW